MSMISEWSSYFKLATYNDNNNYNSNDVDRKMRKLLGNIGSDTLYHVTDSFPFTVFSLIHSPKVFIPLQLSLSLYPFCSCDRFHDHPGVNSIGRNSRNRNHTFWSNDLQCWENRFRSLHLSLSLCMRDFQHPIRTRIIFTKSPLSLHISPAPAPALSLLKVERKSLSVYVDYGWVRVRVCVEIHISKGIVYRTLFSWMRIITQRVLHITCIYAEIITETHTHTFIYRTMPSLSPIDYEHNQCDKLIVVHSPYISCFFIYFFLSFSCRLFFSLWCIHFDKQPIYIPRSYCCEGICCFLSNPGCF